MWNLKILRGDYNCLGAGSKLKLYQISVTEKWLKIDIYLFNINRLIVGLCHNVAQTEKASQKHVLQDFGVKAIGLWYQYFNCLGFDGFFLGQNIRLLACSITFIANKYFIRC